MVFRFGDDFVCCLMVLFRCLRGVVVIVLDLGILDVGLRGFVELFGLIGASYLFWFVLG